MEEQINATDLPFLIGSGSGVLVSNRERETLLDFDDLLDGAALGGRDGCSAESFIGVFGLLGVTSPLRSLKL